MPVTAPLTCQLAALPLGYLVTRTAFSRRGILGSLVRWGPLVFAAMRGIGAVCKSGGGSGRKPG